MDCPTERNGGTVMKGSFTDERNVQIVLSLLKAHNIRKVIVSPGTTNASLIGSMQNDDYFILYSAPEERSAGYMACGMAAETGEPIVLSCTGATASRNYMPALTEAYYRKLPILVITSSRRNAYIGHYIEQVTDRTQLPNDVVHISVQVPIVYDGISEWQCTIEVNKAILALSRKDRGPAHINLETTYSTNTVKMYEPARAIYRYTDEVKWPDLGGKIAIIVGAHIKWNDELTASVDEFCGKYNAIVLCDQTSNYWGKYRVFGCLAAFQQGWKASFRDIDIAIHIGYVSAAVYKVDMREVWRVDPDGELRDSFQRLKYVFETSELSFFKNYNLMLNTDIKEEFLDKCLVEEQKLRENIPDLPFSNAWLARLTAEKLPRNAVLHLGINNSLRVWNFFDHKYPIMGYSNVGGFGIDGALSTAMGAALSTSKIVFCILGDLAFFYDMNCLGNRHFPKNIRILIINNGLGMEMSFGHSLAHKIAESLNIQTEQYISAAGHYSNKSKDLVKEYAKILGIEYHSAESKKEYLNLMPMFTSKDERNRPLIIEAFVDPNNETKANDLLSKVLETQSHAMKNIVKNIIGEKAASSLKKMVKG